MDVFCKIVAGEIPSKVIYEDEILEVILDVNPQKSGHCLIIPKNHYTDLLDISEDTLIHIMKTSKKICNLLYEKLHCDGVMLVQNNGIVEEVKHYHLHLIPQYENEPNLSIDDVYNLLTSK